MRGATASIASYPQRIVQSSGTSSQALRLVHDWGSKERKKKPTLIRNGYTSQLPPLNYVLSGIRSVLKESNSCALKIPKVYFYRQSQELRSWNLSDTVTYLFYIGMLAMPPLRCNSLWRICTPILYFQGHVVGLGAIVLVKIMGAGLGILYRMFDCLPRALQLDGDSSSYVNGSASTIASRRC